MTLETTRQKQSRFALDTARLILKAYELGYELTYGETWRMPEQAKLNAAKNSGISNSLHIDRLAVDFNLFKDGKWLQASEDFLPLGEYWESLGPDNRWGGRFKDRLGRPKPDGNHFSIEHEGRK